MNWRWTTDTVKAMVINMYVDNIQRKDIVIATNLSIATVCRIINKWLHTADFKPVPIVDENPHICSYFGCGHHLTRRELLYGSRCINHQETVKLTHEINKVL